MIVLQIPIDQRTLIIHVKGHSPITKIPSTLPALAGQRFSLAFGLTELQDLLLLACNRVGPQATQLVSLAKPAKMIALSNLAGLIVVSSWL